MVKSARKIKVKSTKVKTGKASGRRVAATTSARNGSVNQEQTGKKLWSRDLEYLLKTKYSSVESAIQDLASRVVARVYPQGKAAAVAQGYLTELLLNDPQLVERLRENLNIAQA